MGIALQYHPRLHLAARRAVLSILILVAIIAPVASIGGTISAVEQDCDYEFYSANDVVTYDPCAQTCAPAGSGGITLEDSKETAEAVFKFFISTPFSSNDNKPLNAVQAAGFLGNMQAESGVDSKTIQGHKAYDDARARNPGVGGYAFGLVQWDSGRRVALIKYADSKSKKWDDLETQLNYLKTELEGSEKKIITDSTYKTTTDPGVAARRVTDLFERPGTPHYEKRVEYANTFYNKFKGLAPGEVSFGAGGRCSLGADNGSIVDTAILLAWPDKKPNGFFENKPEYQKALEETGVNKLGDSCSMGGNSCDAFVATVMRYSGLDKDFHCCSAAAQQEYMTKHPEKYQAIGRIADTSQMQAGDIMWRPGHIKIYLGDGRQADASHCQRTASISPKTFFDGSYYAFRFIGSGSSPPGGT